jgi:NAD(P)-dependent dehydrogenase (short-subunit alcohol dehydrogenase family)
MLNSKVLITGASRGFGYALTVEYARHGHTVVALLRSPESVAQASKIPGNVIPVLGDVTKEESLDSLSKTLNNIGTLDTLINNAGIPGSAYGGCRPQISIVDRRAKTSQWNFLFA